MRILYLSQYFPPEAGATQNRAMAMAAGLARHGHDVTVLCEVPNHPKGIIQAGFRCRRRLRRCEQGVDVRHLWVFARPTKSFRTRLLFYLTYMAHAVCEGLCIRRVALVYASSPPLFVAAAGALLAWLKGCQFVMEVRDFWPEAAVQLGELRPGRAQRWAERLEAWCYGRSVRIVVVTQGAAHSLGARFDGRYRERVRLIPNGSDEALLAVTPLPATRPSALQGRFVVLYAGLMGLAQGLESVLETARLLASTDVHFLLVGEGPTRAELEARARSLGLQNVTFRDGVPVEELLRIYAQADAAVVPLRRLPLFRETVPSKLFDCMAAGLPVLLGVDGEARALLERAGAGLFVQPEDPVDLAQAIERLRGDPALVRAMGVRGREFVRQHYTRTAQADMLARELELLTIERFHAMTGDSR